MKSGGLPGARRQGRCRDNASGWGWVATPTPWEDSEFATPGDRGERPRRDLLTVFKIDAHRSGDVLLEVLGREFAGVVGCDYFSAYRRYMRECNVLVQFCLAHLIRDIKF